MKRTLAIAMLIALAPLAAGAGSLGVITGTMRGPAGPMTGVRVQAVNTTGSIVGSATTDASGAYALAGLPAGTFVVQAVGSNGTVLTTSTATLTDGTMTTTKHLASTAAAAAPAAQSAATGGSVNAKAIWWIVGASAATAGIISAVALEDDPSPSY